MELLGLVEPSPHLSHLLLVILQDHVQHARLLGVEVAVLGGGGHFKEQRDTWRHMMEHRDISRHFKEQRDTLRKTSRNIETHQGHIRDTSGTLHCLTSLVTDTL